MNRENRTVCDDAREIFSALGDELSCRIYEERVLHSLTGDLRPLRRILLLTEEGKAFQDALHLLPAGVPRLIYGAGERGAYLPFWWDSHFTAYIDADERKQGTRLNGLRIYALEDALKEYPDAAIIITNRYGFDEIEQMLLAKGVRENRIINFARLDHALEKKQYFDLAELPHVKEECFVDGGTFDGASSLAFKDWCGADYSHVYAFEPDAANRFLCECAFSANLPAGSYDVVPKGLWETGEELTFSSGDGYVSSFRDDGKETVPVISMDEALHGKRVTFLKLDIEGAEYAALRGARNILLEQQPKCAISVYHKPEDIFVLPKFLREVYPQAVFYFRHYVLREYDTVMYVVTGKGQ